LHETTEEELVAPKACTFSVVERKNQQQEGGEDRPHKTTDKTAKGGRKARE
jgi:hypothetical protein